MRKDLRPEELGDLLEQPRLAILATRFADGEILLSPVWHEWADGGFTIVIVRDDVKERHLRRDSRASAVVAEEVHPSRSIEVRGRAELAGSPSPELLRRLSVRYLGDAEGERYFRSLRADEMTVVRLAPGVLRAWDYRDGV